MSDLGLTRIPAGSLALEARASSLTAESAAANPEKVAGDLEALFATLLVKELRRALPDGFFGKGAGADTFEGWFDEHLGRSLADSGALDLAGQIKVDLQRKAGADE